MHEIVDNSEVKTKLFSLEDGRHNPAIFTFFSLQHFLTGYIGFVILNKMKLSHAKSTVVLFIVHTLYELKDCYVSYYEKDMSYWGDNSIINSVGDTILFAIGMYAAILVGKNAEYYIFTQILIVITIGFYMTNLKLG